LDQRNVALEKRVEQQIKSLEAIELNLNNSKIDFNGNGNGWLLILKKIYINVFHTNFDQFNLYHNL
jgi:hypothetical protein